MADSEQAVPSQDDWVRLISSDGYTFLVKRKVAIASQTLRSMLDVSSSFAESASNTCRLNERGTIVEKLLEYLSHKSLYENASRKEDIPAFSERIAPEIALELLMAADYYEENAPTDAKSRFLAVFLNDYRRTEI